MTANGYNSCEQIKDYYAIYPLPIAAALWCGVPAHQVNDHLHKATEVYRGVFALSYIPCLEPRCRAIHNAIDSGILPVCREKGMVVEEHVAPERRHIRREDLKNWIAKAFPDDKPNFLFDAIERKTHSAISIESYKALEIEKNTAQTELEKAKARIKQVTGEKDALLGERDSLKAMVDRYLSQNLSDSERNSLLKLVIGMAIDAYNYDPNGTRNSATGDKNGIRAKLQTHGINIDDDTIRKYLTEAKKTPIACKPVIARIITESVKL